MKFTVMLTADTTVSGLIVVEAATKEEAAELALEAVANGTPMKWELDDGNALAPYIADEISEAVRAQ